MIEDDDGIEIVPMGYVQEKLKILGPDLYNNRDMADCRLLLGEKTQFYGHELFLSSASQYFRDLFFQVKAGIEREDVNESEGLININIPIEESDAAYFRDVLRWVGVFFFFAFVVFCLLSNPSSIPDKPQTKPYLFSSPLLSLPGSQKLVPNTDIYQEQSRVDKLIHGRELPSDLQYRSVPRPRLGRRTNLPQFPAVGILKRRSSYPREEVEAWCGRSPVYISIARVYYPAKDLPLKKKQNKKLRSPPKCGLVSRFSDEKTDSTIPRRARAWARETGQ